jgi:hypothetical protein
MLALFQMPSICQCRGRGVGIGSWRWKIQFRQSKRLFGLTSEATGAMQKWTPGTHRGVFRCDVQQNIMMSRNGTRGLVIGEAAVGQKGASEIFIQCRTEEVSGTMARMESCIEVAVQGTGMISCPAPRPPRKLPEGMLHLRPSVISEIWDNPSPSSSHHGQLSPRDPLITTR